MLLLQLDCTWIEPTLSDGLGRFDTVLLTRTVLHKANEVSQKHDDGHFTDGRDVY